jgi:membrane-associated phospholipid phosphatase
VGQVDRTAYLWVIHHRVSWLDPVLVGVTLVATGGFVWVALAPLLALVARRRPFLPLLLTAAAVWGADLAASSLKRAVHRPRPYGAVGHVHLLVGRASSASLPSAHATTSFGGATILALLFPRLAGPLFAAAALVAFSRVYVGVHYPGDVLAGALLGSAIGAAVWLLARLAASRLRRGG